MRNLIFFMHASLDGYVAGPNGEMNWIKIDEEIFDFVATITQKADAALYGRKTYEMMQGYWPTAADKPNATKHDIEHSAWYKQVAKIVLSKTISAEGLDNTSVIAENLADEIKHIKNQDGQDILIFGSPSASHALLDHNLIDEFWIMVNPILIGKGTPLFKNIHQITELNLLETKTFSNGVVAMHYEKADA